MSLLIKALAQAAKDRDAANVEPGTTSDAKGGELRVESTRTATSLSLEAPGQKRAAPSLAGLAQIEAQQRARAAAVVQAGERPASKIVDYVRASPVLMLGAVAGLFGIGFGVYVYLQIANPGAFSRKPPPAPPQVTAPTPPPVPPAGPQPTLATPAPEMTGAGAAASSPPVVPGSTSASSSTVAGAGAIPGAAAGAGTASAPAASAASAPIPTASVVSSSAADRMPERGPGAEPPRERQTARAADPQKAPPRGTPEPAAAPRERIVVSAGAAKPTLNPNLTLAYSALQSGDVEQARGLYTRVSQAEPLNIDALLGLAYLAARENRSDDAMKQYVRILQLDPRHALAQAGMIALMGRADPLSAEARLKQLIAREPSPFLHFILGNLYADQDSWPQAQQSYFQAHHLEPSNPDYAYNLAVGLDHLRQPKPALDYYRRAADLAAAQGRANFNLSHARERIGILSSQLQ